MNNYQEEKQNIHFVGIGGIGVSALAKYFLSHGFRVSGSDVAENESIKELKKLGAEIFIGHRASNLAKLNFAKVVYSAAVQPDNPEIAEAKKLGIKCQTYAQALGELTKEKFTIAVSGTHGKSTTTAMLGLALEAAGLDPMVIVGTKVGWNQKLGITNQESGNMKPSNFRSGKGKYLVVEADEYAASFLNYWPKIIVLTNIEEDHLDFYTGGLKQIKETFAEFINHLGDDGVLVANGEDINIGKITNYKLQIINKNQKSKFQIIEYHTKKIPGLKLKVPGRHNLSNANAVIEVARILGIPDEKTIEALNNFDGTWRRMEFKGELNGAKIYDDYGHHPTEIKATLRGAKELLGDRRSANGNKRLWCVFQPHQYQRTHQLFEGFAGAFDDADNLILLPIFSVAGREDEEIKKKVNSEMLADRIRIMNYESGIKNKKIFYAKNFEKAAAELRQNLKKGDICLVMGAGDIYKLTEKLLSDS